jgi:hypothetical protein
MYHKQSGSPDHTIAKTVTVPPLLGRCTTTCLRAMVLCLPVNVIKECLTGIHLLSIVVMPGVLLVAPPQWAASPIKYVTQQYLALVDGARVMWMVEISLPMPSSLAEVAVWPGGASVISVADPITIALTTIVLAFPGTSVCGTVTVSPWVRDVEAFYC